MLSDNDFEWLVGQLAATAEMLGQQITPAAALLMAEDLASYPKEVLANALRRLRTEYTGRLTPKAIIDRIDELSGRLTANEAWALALQSLDEKNTVVWTNEIRAAWATAQGVAVAGDKVGARMAFIASYDRIVKEARDSHAVPMTEVSEGWDKELRKVAIERAVTAGLLTSAQAQQHLPQIGAPAFNPAALLTTDLSQPVAAPQEIKDKINSIRIEIKQRAEQEDLVRAANVKQEQAAWDEKKRRAAEIARAAVRMQPPKVGQESEVSA